MCRTMKWYAEAFRPIWCAGINDNCWTTTHLNEQSFIVSFRRYNWRALQFQAFSAIFSRLTKISLIAPCKQITWFSSPAVLVIIRHREQRNTSFEIVLNAYYTTYMFVGSAVRAYKQRAVIYDIIAQTLPWKHIRLAAKKGLQWTNKNKWC